MESALSVNGFSTRALIGDTNEINSNRIKYRFLCRGENRSTQRKTSRSRVENQRTQPTYEAESENRTRVTLVAGERSSPLPCNVRSEDSSHKDNT